MQQFSTDNAQKCVQKMEKIKSPCPALRGKQNRIFKILCVWQISDYLRLLVDYRVGRLHVC